MLKIAIIEEKKINIKLKGDSKFLNGILQFKQSDFLLTIS